MASTTVVRCVQYGFASVVLLVSWGYLFLAEYGPLHAVRNGLYVPAILISNALAFFVSMLGYCFVRKWCIEDSVVGEERSGPASKFLWRLAYCITYCASVYGENYSKGKFETGIMFAASKVTPLWACLLYYPKSVDARMMSQAQMTWFSLGFSMFALMSSSYHQSDAFDPVGFWTSMFPPIAYCISGSLACKIIRDSGGRGWIVVFSTLASTSAMNVIFLTPYLFYTKDSIRIFEIASYVLGDAHLTVYTLFYVLSNSLCLVLQFWMMTRVWTPYYFVVIVTADILACPLASSLFGTVEHCSKDPANWMFTMLVVFMFLLFTLDMERMRLSKDGDSKMKVKSTRNIMEDKLDNLRHKMVRELDAKRDFVLQDMLHDLCEMEGHFKVDNDRRTHSNTQWVEYST